MTPDGDDQCGPGVQYGQPCSFSKGFPHFFHCNIVSLFPSNWGAAEQSSHNNLCWQNSSAGEQRMCPSEVFVMERKEGLEVLILTRQQTCDRRGDRTNRKDGHSPFSTLARSCCDDREKECSCSLSKLSQVCFRKSTVHFCQVRHTYSLCGALANEGFHIKPSPE